MEDEPGSDEVSEVDIPIMWEEQCPVTNPTEPTDEAKVSIHVMSGTEGACTLKVQGTLKGNTINILIDSGSTHNFISQHLIKKLNLSSQPYSPFSIIVANGDKLQCESMLDDIH